MISQPKQVLVLLKLFFDSTLANLYATQNSSRRGLLNTASENRPLFHSKPLSGSPFQSEQKQKPLCGPSCITYQIWPVSVFLISPIHLLCPRASFVSPQSLPTHRALCSKRTHTWFNFPLSPSLDSQYYC